jgi:hypothetical protein
MRQFSNRGRHEGRSLGRERPRGRRVHLDDGARSSPQDRLGSLAVLLGRASKLRQIARMEVSEYLDGELRGHVLECRTGELCWST